MHSFFFGDVGGGQQGNHQKKNECNQYGLSSILSLSIFVCVRECAAEKKKCSTFWSLVVASITVSAGTNWSQWNWPKWHWKQTNKRTGLMSKLLTSLKSLVDFVDLMHFHKWYGNVRKQAEKIQKRKEPKQRHKRLYSLRRCDRCPPFFGCHLSDSLLLNFRQPGTWKLWNITTRMLLIRKISVWSSFFCKISNYQTRLEPAITTKSLPQSTHIHWWWWVIYIRWGVHQTFSLVLTTSFFFFSETDGGWGFVFFLYLIHKTELPQLASRPLNPSSVPPYHVMFLGWEKKNNFEK